MLPLDTLERVDTLDELAALLRSDAWKQYLTALAKRPDAADEVARMRTAVTDAKRRLSPEHTSVELQTLKGLVYRDDADPATQRALLTRIAAVRAALPMRQHERLVGQLETAVGQRFADFNTGTGRSNRARRASDLFTDFAGQTRIEGAATDRHGNAEGTGYDLGRDGAFEGHTVHVLHLYTGEGFDFAKPGAAFRRKGFHVERLTAPGTPEALAAWLADAKQLWLISTAKGMLTPAHVEVIRAFWQRGGALYLWGDNKPYYVEANQVLAALFGDDLGMLGDLPGGKVVHELGAARTGFPAHLVTTGLVHLFEGITVASLTESVAERYGFTPLLYGSAGNLITVVRDPTPTCGAVMVDTAFTRLFVQWDDAGSARYVCNAACFLAAMTLPAEEPAPETSGDDEEAPEALRYDPEGALAGVCDLTAEAPATWLVLSVAAMGDALRNTSDMVLNDPLCAGAWNLIFSDQVYGEAMGQWIVGQGSDPFTRRPVVECLPLVDLSRGGNLREFTLLLCKCLMGAKYLPTAARLLFFAVVDAMLDPARRADHPEAWEHLYRQCLANFTSTPEFNELGRKVPLLEAMAAYFSPATDARAQVRLSFTSVGVIGRTLLREGRCAPAQVRLIARRALVKALVGDAVAAEKAAPGTVHPAALDALYESFHGMPTLHGGRLAAAWPAFARDVTEARLRIERDLGALLVTPDELTVTMHALLSLDLRQYTAESALARLEADSAPFRAVWNDAGPVDALALLDARFEKYATPLSDADPHLVAVPPFATTYGPSVYRCVCGHAFGDPRAELTEASLAALQQARTAHFREVYRARADGWYPGEGTLHYNLHRAVQRTLTDHFEHATELSDAMVPAVAAYLKRDGKGFLCDPRIEPFIRGALDSYLALRRAGQPHPEGLLTLAVKARRERELRAV